MTAPSGSNTPSSNAPERTTTDAGSTGRASSAEGPSTPIADPPPPGATADRSEVRFDIQALRTLAVGLVVIYHLWPRRVTGGYIGVDVFFVISGFLITAHLLREADRTGRIALARFWARRARRLLPASLLVLAVAALATWIWIPSSLWVQFYREIGASALYVQNWVLSIDAVDYLAANNQASPAQHFWSLSAEEQFYMVWPLLMLLAVFSAGKLGRNRHLFVAVALGLVTVGSLVLSAFWTAANPASAYFVTPVRVWEFAAGGLLAVLSPTPSKMAPAVRAVIAWIGLAAIVATALLYTDATPFPGLTALLPVGGTLLVLWVGTPALSWSPAIIGDRRPVQFLGDISYSVYLWHWPMIVVLPYALGADLDKWSKLLIVAGTIVLAWLTKIFIEDPVRTGRMARARPRWVLISAAAGMAVVVLLSNLGTGRANTLADEAEAAANVALAGNMACFGAASMDPALKPCVNPELDNMLVPAPVAAKRDTGDSYSCYSAGTSGKVRTCTLEGSSKTPKKRIALIGDSHAAMLRPAVKEILKDKDWEVDIFLKQACPWTAAPVVRLDVAANWPKLCASYNEELQARLEDPKQKKYDLIVVNAARNDLVALNPGENETDVEVAGYMKAWTPVLKAGTPIMVLVDNPLLPMDWLDCVEKGDAADARKCGVSKAEGLAMADTQELAAQQLENTTIVDMTDFYCDGDFCPVAIGGVLVYRDESHITKTWSLTIAPYLGAAIEKALAN